MKDHLPTPPLKDKSWPFKHIWKFHIDTKHDSNGWWDWKTKKKNVLYLSFWGARDPRDPASDFNHAAIASAAHGSYSAISSNIRRLRKNEITITSSIQGG